MNKRFIFLAATLALAATTDIQLSDIQKSSCFIMDGLTFYDYVPLWKDANGYTVKNYVI